MAPDCIVIGFNEPPFERYEALVRNYGDDSEAYRDLRFSFVDVGGRKLTYVDLLNQAYAWAGAEPPRHFKSCDIPNLAAVYLANFLRKRGVAADYINLFQFEKDALARQLDDDPLCVAITTTFYVINFPVREMVRFIRERNPRVRIVVGGPLVANYARQSEDRRPVSLVLPGREVRRHEREAPPDLVSALEDIGADIYVVEGQGEATLLDIVETLKAGRSLASVPNILYTEDGVLVRNPRRPEENHLDECDIDWLAFSDRDLGHTIQTRTARSCAFSCAFCNYPGRAGNLALSSLDTVKRELDAIRELGGVRNVVFIDDTFNVPLPRFKDLCRLMIREEYPFNWYSYFRCSNSDREAFDLMAASGCKGVFLGIESGSPTVLKHMNKSATVERYADGIRLLKERGILTFASFILGFPGETAETVRETADFIERNRPDYYRVQPWYCEPGTPIDRRRDEFQIEGDGFVWTHKTMDSLTAADHIERLFLTVRHSQWLPQWSFDFWIIPYLTGEGIDAASFARFMTLANQLLALEIASVGRGEKEQRQAALVRELAAWAKTRTASEDACEETVAI
jgi:p-methyltransferase